MKTIVLVAGLLMNHTLGLGLSISSYNTYLIPTNKHAASTMPRIINEIKKSDLDLICLQELYVPSMALQFQAAVSSEYPYSFSEANTLDLKTPRTPCSSSQKALLQSQCISNTCASLFEVDPNQFIACAAIHCQNDIFPLMDTECLTCMIMQSSFNAEKLSFDESMTVCTSKLPFSSALTGDNIVLSKYPIVNKWIYKYPSHFVHENILVTEIDVSQITHPIMGKDTIIFGCTHLVATDGQGPYFPTSKLEIELGIKSYDELNEWQTHDILEKFLVPNFVEMNGNVVLNNNVIGLFIAGDLNVGRMVFPQNLQIWQDDGFKPVQDLEYEYDFLNEYKSGAKCTYCADANGRYLQNKLAIDGCDNDTTPCKVKDVDIDHILVYTDCLINITPIAYKRIFTQKFDIDGEYVPLSDHWGVVFVADLPRYLWGGFFG